jgi:caa(3)-type oxidase subunit IV
MTPRSLIITFVGLVVLAAASWVFSSPALSLGIAAAKAVWIGLVFMELREAHPVPRAIAVIAVLFVLLLTIGAWTDTVLRM